MSEQGPEAVRDNDLICSSTSIVQSNSQETTPEVGTLQDKGLQKEADEEPNEEEDDDRISVSSSYEEFCGQQASEINLRRLKMDALEDLVVCGQSREAIESARRLFSGLSSTNSDQQQPQQQQKQQQVTINRRRQGDSLSSRSSGHGDELEDQDDEDGLMAALSRDKQLADQRNSSSSNNNNNNQEHIIEEIYASERRLDDYGTIKIARRKACPSACSDCSAGNSSGRPHSSYGSTLVCSLSPSRASQASSENAGEQSPSPSEDLSYYPIDGDEIRQCREAFRENRRLIEQAQALAFKRMQEQAAEAPAGVQLSRCSSQTTLLTDRSHWTDSLSRRKKLPDCSHCRQKVYPLDRLELDFTRAKLNIHRNCFKCQVCHTLLRLETYASIDAKLFCPAHTKLATPVASR